MIGAGSFRSKQQEYKIDRLAIERLEIDRPIEPRKQTKQLVELCELAVRDGDAVADAGRAELLTLQQDLVDGAFVLAAELGRLSGEFLQGLLLSVDLERGNDRVGRDEIGERHGPVPGNQQAEREHRRGRRRTIRSTWWPVNGRSLTCSFARFSWRCASRCGRPALRARADRSIRYGRRRADRPD